MATLPALMAGHALARRPRADTQAVLGWGFKPSAEHAAAVARAHGLPLWRLEDAFLRSVTLGADGPPFGVVIDDIGLYHDASAPSRLEALVQALLTPARAARADALVQQWRQAGVSKYNHARDAAPPLPGPFVLLLDQTAGDAAIALGGATPRSFTEMLQAALDEHPALPVVLKVHPDVLAGRKAGHLGRLTPGQAARVTVLAADVHVAGLLDSAAAVYTVTSQTGFEGLLRGCPVRCFGMPFYAGWGLTQDMLAAPARRAPVLLQALVHAALVDYARYVDPQTLLRCEIEALVAWAGLQRRMRQRFAPQVHALGFSRWKKPIVRAYFSGSQVHFIQRPADTPAGATVALWGRRTAPPQAGSTVRLEDGFLRSVGLGADLVRPLSWAMDTRGMYYDPAEPSDLEHLLQTHDFDPALCARAAALRGRINAEGITKYNVGSGVWQRPVGARRVVLVVGQVESDASITHAAPGVRSNIALLQAARAAAPHAHLVYKPHPDVVARLRRAGSGEHRAASVCDELVVDVPMHLLLAQVDEVQVLTSLAGFEALLRGVAVVTHGQPFYAGWGLTQDLAPPPRRGKVLSLDALVAGALLLYPSYVSQRSGTFCTAETVLDELLAWRDSGSQRPAAWRRLWRGTRRALWRAWRALTAQ
ncbi:MAG: capsular polysaccharide biosynthesis protein [Aquabacterium sp.]|nr:capsular polysaccharide biosynthesis protein [Aquabacterium sp.]